MQKVKRAGYRVPKRQKQSLFGPIVFNFTSPFTPEECVCRLENADYQITRNVKIIISQEDDAYRFRIVGGNPRIEANAELTPWHGTATLVSGVATWRGT